MIHWKIIHKKDTLKTRTVWMLHSCDDCPGEDGIHEFLTSVF